MKPNEERVAIKIGQLLNDYNLYLPYVGYYLVINLPEAVLEKLFEVMKETKKQYDRIDAQNRVRKDYQNGNTLF